MRSNYILKEMSLILNIYKLLAYTERWNKHFESCFLSLCSLMLFLSLWNLFAYCKTLTMNIIILGKLTTCLLLLIENSDYVSCIFWGALGCLFLCLSCWQIYDGRNLLVRVWCTSANLFMRKVEECLIFCRFV